MVPGTTKLPSATVPLRELAIPSQSTRDDVQLRAFVP